MPDGASRPPRYRRSKIAAVVGSAVLLLGACSSTARPSNPGDALSTDPLAPTRPTVPAGGPTAEIGVFDDRVVFGQSAAFSGPAAELGIGMQLGIRAAFAEANREGGIAGRRVDLVSRDDAYEPEAAVTNTRKLIEEDQVFALIGPVGTPTSRSATPVAAAAGVPYVAPFTGAGFLRDDDWYNIVNLRASYAQETEEMVERLTVDLGIERIAVMFQDDSFGRAGYFGALAALERRGMEPVAIGFYPRNTTAVKSALLDLRAGDPEAVIVVGAYQPVAALITWARSTGFDPVFITLSFVGSNALATRLAAEGGGEGVYVTQVVPFPFDESVPVVASYQAALSQIAPETRPGFVSLEGYIAGRLALAGMAECGALLTRQCFLDALLGADELDIDGFTLRFGEGDAITEDNQGSDAVFVTVIGSYGAYRAVSTLTGAQQ